MIVKYRFLCLEFFIYYENLCDCGLLSTWIQRIVPYFNRVSSCWSFASRLSIKHKSKPESKLSFLRKLILKLSLTTIAVSNAFILFKKHSQIYLMPLFNSIFHIFSFQFNLKVYRKQKKKSLKSSFFLFWYWFFSIALFFLCS